MQKKIRFEITGEAPLLMHRRINDDDPAFKHFGIVLPKKGNLRDEDYARVHAYWSLDYKHLVVPADCVRESIKNVSKSYSAEVFGKKQRSMYKFVSGGMFIEPELIPLHRDGKPRDKYDKELFARDYGIPCQTIREYDIDIRSVRINKGPSIFRARAKIVNWRATFDVIYIDSVVGNNFANSLVNMIEEAGMVMGLLDKRPNQGGDFGRFRLSRVWPEVTISEEHKTAAELMTWEKTA